MMTAKKAFTLIAEEEAAQAPPVQSDPPKPSSFTLINAEILLTSLRALSQRTAMELTRLLNNLFTAGLVLAVWVLVSRTLPEPTSFQLIGVAGFAVFCLLADIVRRKK